MRHALQPLTMYLPESHDGDDQLTMFATGENESYDVNKSSNPPSESQNLMAQKLSSKQVSFFGRLFDPRKFKSHERVKGFISNHHSPPSYVDLDADTAYLDPAVTSEVPTLWVARDPMGISAHEIKDTSKILPMSDEPATFNEKGKVVWDEERVLGAPIREERIDY
ncbi:phosphate metabolism protein 7 [Clarireedia jacksonii]